MWMVEGVSGVEARAESFVLRCRHVRFVFAFVVLSFTFDFDFCIWSLTGMSVRLFEFWAPSESFHGKGLERPGVSDVRMNGKVLTDTRSRARAVFCLGTR